MGGQSGLSELSIISWMSAFEGCPLSGVPLYCVQPLVCLMRYQPWVPCCSWHSSERSERRDRSWCRYHTVAQGSKSFLHVFPLSPSSRVLLHPGLHPAPPSPHQLRLLWSLLHLPADSPELWPSTLPRWGTQMPVDVTGRAGCIKGGYATQ